MYLLSHLILSPKCESPVLGAVEIRWKIEYSAMTPLLPLLPMMMNGLRVLVSREHVKKFTSICKQPTRTTCARASDFHYFGQLFV